MDLRHIPPEKIGAWGMKWEDGRVTGYGGGKAVAEARFASNPVVSSLEAAADDAVLDAGAKDVTRVTVAAADRAGNPLV